MAVVHPEPDERGRGVLLKRPSTATPLSAWERADAVATVTPAGALPAALNGILFQDWLDAPDSAEAWSQVEGQAELSEPPFQPPTGKMPAAGVAIQEPNGRFWLVAPSNAFGGYAATFPKGRVEGRGSCQASAIREAYEEAGLKVRITGFLAASDRTQSYTRYYLAQRLGGTRHAWAGNRRQCISCHARR